MDDAETRGIYAPGQQEKKAIRSKVGRKKTAAVNLDALNGAAANLRALAGDDMTQAALSIVRERLDLTPEKLALLFLRILNPDQIIGQGEEAEIRGIPKRDTLTEYKQQGHFPRFMNGHFEKGQRA